MSSKIRLPVYWIDAFTDQPFGGNPAAVCITEHPLEAELMQDLALEFGLSETAFVHPLESGWKLRWFTPKAEVRLCGHATVAAATALWARFPETLGPHLEFHTLSGRLQARRQQDQVELSFPARPPQVCPPPEGLLEGLGLSPTQISWCGRDADDYILLVGSESEITTLQPNFATLLSVETRGIMVTAKSENIERDFVSRFFAPKVGVNEDPVTGSAHCCLTPFWSERLKKTSLKAEQLSERGGKLSLKLQDERVLLRGSSYMLLQGELQLPN